MSRLYEHRRFLDWLTDTLEALAVDVLLIAGDVFDSANPPAAAEALWYTFLAKTRQRLPAVDIVVIGGNHDSPARLEAPAHLLKALRIHVVGSLGGTKSIDLDRLLVPVHDRDGRVGGCGGRSAILAALRFTEAGGAS